MLRVYLRQDTAYRERVFGLVRRTGQPLLLGALDQPADGAGELNSMYLIAPANAQDPAPFNSAQGRLRTRDLQVYHKQTLLPFGEYVPGAAWLPFFTRWRTTGRFVSGGDVRGLILSREATEKRAHSHAARAEHDSPTRVTTFAPSICFEAVLPGFFNRMVRDGADLLVNLTDDGWFGDTAGPYQHLQAATLRAVETRRWLVRASNSGVSAFIDPTGRIVASLPLGAVGVLSHGIETAQIATVYVPWGNWIMPLSALLLAFVFWKRTGETHW